jgi:hypothetical protein
MGGSRGDEERITLHQDDLAPGNPEPRLPLEQQDPLVLGLIVEHGLGTLAADDPLDAYRAKSQQILEDLSLGELGEV